MSSLAISSRPRYLPRNVMYLDTIYTPFKYPTELPRLKSFTLGSDVNVRGLDGQRFTFKLVKSDQRSISICCQRDFTGPCERDEGYFLRLYVSVIGVNEKPKRASLESSRRGTFVKFRQASFERPAVDLSYVYTLKCTFRKIETTVLSNELRREQERVWQERVLRTCTSSQIGEMAYVMKYPNLQKVFTGRSVNHYMKSDIVASACRYSKVLALYFKHKKQSRSSPPEFIIARILGYMVHGTEVCIDNLHCIILYYSAIRLGLMFVKELAVDLLIKNLDDESLTLVLELADATEDTLLFDAAFTFCIRSNRLRIFSSREWKSRTERFEDSHIPRSIVHGFLLRILTGGENLATSYTQDEGFPPAIEKETRK